MRRFAFAVLTLLMTARIVLAAEDRQTYPYYAPKLENSKNGAVHDSPLGVLSATGRLTHGATAIFVKDMNDPDEMKDSFEVHETGSWPLHWRGARLTSVVGGSYNQGAARYPEPPRRSRPAVLSRGVIWRGREGVPKPGTPFRPRLGEEAPSCHKPLSIPKN
jgi:hypothetical protein